MMRGNVSIKSSVPKLLNLILRLSRLSLSKISNDLWEIISPASISTSIYMIVTPVFVKPFIRARCTGAPPLNLGNKDGWTFMQPYLG